MKKVIKTHIENTYKLMPPAVYKNPSGMKYEITSVLEEWFPDDDDGEGPAYWDYTLRGFVLMKNGQRGKYHNYISTPSVTNEDFTKKVMDEYGLEMK